ncbi:hypothetical protein APHAL10511_001385 [Amanita phalloides]|nr:hypothetical protein APHAL10511_001385 [Amanita phalloides]
MSTTDAREDLPRISIENTQSWQQLIARYKETVLRRLEEDIGTSLANERDALRPHVLRFIDQTLSTARPNLRINGQPYEHSDDNQCEPFDEALDRRIWSLADTRMQWLKRVADTRRNLPIAIATEVTAMAEAHQLTENHIWSDTQFHESVTSDVCLHKDNIHKLIVLGDELNQTLPEQCHRAEKTKAAAAEIRTHKL